jgi:hypothetical protein
MQPAANQILEASTALAALAEQKGIPAARILGRRTDTVGIVIRFDAANRNQALVIQSGADWELQVAGANFGPETSIFVFPTREQAVEAVNVISARMFGGAALVTVH